MNVEPFFQNSSEWFGVPVRKNSYTGSEKSYITWVYADERPDTYGDDTDLFDLTEISMHWFSQTGSDTAAQKKKIRRFLRNLGFTIQSTVDMVESDTGVNHVIVYATIEGTVEEEFDDG